jgi:hypothetical protein
MPNNRTLKIAAVIAGSFAALAGTIIFLLVVKVITVEMALLMLVALVGLYFGFGILIAVWRFVSKLE